jgi:hypothetical protein
MDSFTAIWVQDEKEVERLLNEGWELKLVREGSHWKNHLLVKEDDDRTEQDI